MRYDLNTRTYDRTADEVEASIKNSRKKINEYDQAIEATIRLREHNPWKADQERIRLAALKDVELQRLARLADEYRQVKPTSNEWRPAPSGFWRPEGT